MAVLSLALSIFSGGSGFLGQHIVRLIEERDPTVKEIRIVDLRPYENRLSKYQGEGEKRKNQTREKLISNPISGLFSPSRIFSSCVCLFFSLLVSRRWRLLHSCPRFSIC